MRFQTLALFLVTASLAPAEQHPLEQLIEVARPGARASGLGPLIAQHGVQGAQTQYPSLDERRRGRPRERSWLLAAENIQLANSPKLRGYDHHFRFGQAAHNSSQEAIDLPESLVRLWRGYDPAKTSEEFTIDLAERDRPYYRVTTSNRDAW